MKKDEFARELMMGEVNKERGGFVTTRIIDRLMLLYAPLFDRELLTAMAEIVNRELSAQRSGRGGDEPRQRGKASAEAIELGGKRRLTPAFNH